MDMKHSAQQTLISLILLVGVNSAIAANPTTVPCPCTFSANEIKTKFAGFTNGGEGSCMANNSVVIDKKVSPDGTPIIVSSVTLTLMGTPNRDTQPASGGARPDMKSIMADVEKLMTTWSAGFTSKAISKTSEGMGRSNMMTGRYCTTSVSSLLRGDDKSIPLTDLAQYTACLNDIKAAAATINVPCSP